MIKLLLVWFVAVNTPTDMQPRAILTTDCAKAFDRYTEDLPTIPDAAWRYRCIDIPTISQLEAPRPAPLP